MMLLVVALLITAGVVLTVVPLADCSRCSLNLIRQVGVNLARASENGADQLEILPCGGCEGTGKVPFINFGNSKQH